MHRVGTHHIVSSTHQRPRSMRPFSQTQCQTSSILAKAKTEQEQEDLIK
jgi:hypothetical protein